MYEEVETVTVLVVEEQEESIFDEDFMKEMGA